MYVVTPDECEPETAAIRRKDSSRIPHQAGLKSSGILVNTFLPYRNMADRP